MQSITWHHVNRSHDGEKKFKFVHGPGDVALKWTNILTPSFSGEKRHNNILIWLMTFEAKAGYLEDDLEVVKYHESDFYFPKISPQHSKDKFYY
jgi:hypothetical protein